MTQTKRNYKALFVLDNRGREESADTLIEELKKEISAAGGEVTRVESHGRHDFARIPDHSLTSALYVEVGFSAPPAGPAAVRERFRLNTLVNRIIIEAA